MRPGADEGLRLTALRTLGEDAPPLAREALEEGATEVEPNVLRWTGSEGVQSAHRVVLATDAEVCTRLRAMPSAVDALTSAIAAAITALSGDMLAELKIVALGEPAARTAPYRGRSV